MSSFESFVNSVKDSWRVGKAVKIIYGESKASQRFAILITSGLWYAIRVIMDEDHRDKKGPFDLSPQPDWIIHSEHATLKGAEERANKWKSMLENGEFLEMHKDLWAWSPNEKRPSMKVLPKDCATNPNKYLKPGDLIQTDFYIQANHEGIYIGNGEVIHMSGHGGGKADGKARIGKLYPDFVADKTTTIRIKVFRVRFRSPNEIVETAKEYANGEYRHGEYNLIMKNCQHFATLCALGVEQCGDARTFFTALVNGALIVLPYIL